MASQNTSAIIQASILSIALLVIILLCLRVVIKTIGLSTKPEPSIPGENELPLNGESSTEYLPQNQAMSKFKTREVSK